MIYFKPHQAAAVLAQNIHKKVHTIVEAGSFNGQDTLRLAKQWPLATIHAFEPVPEIYAQLTENTKNTSTIICHQLALSDADGQATIYLSEKDYKPGIISQANSLRKPKERLLQSPMKFRRSITVPTITLDSWAQKNHIDGIDILWLDLQGHELSVLESAQTVIETVTAIHTEVSFIESYEGQPLYHDIQRWMMAHDFHEVARDFMDTSQWFFGNALFIKK